jgi:hypothetical protein
MNDETLLYSLWILQVVLSHLQLHRPSLGSDI